MIVISALLPGCDPGNAYQAIGVSRAEGGEAQIHYVPCPGEVVTDVSVVLPNGIAGDSNDVVLWATHSDTGSKDSVFAVGSTPPGFTLVVPLDQPLPEATSVTAIVSTDRVNDVTVEYSGNELRTDLVLTGRSTEDHNEYVPSAAFESRALSACA